jgi:hypothetical protein
VTESSADGPGVAPRRRGQVARDASAKRFRARAQAVAQAAAEAWALVADVIALDAAAAAGDAQGPPRRCGARPIGCRPSSDRCAPGPGEQAAATEIWSARQFARARAGGPMLRPLGRLAGARSGEAAGAIWLDEANAAQGTRCAGHDRGPHLEP